MKTLTAGDARSLLLGTTECALLDVREQEEFSRCHPLLASCLPLSRLELHMERLVPCKKTAVILMDSGEETFARPRAETAGRRLEAAGYENVGILEGGLAAWKAAGMQVFTGVGALSKAFGEHIEEELDTPRLEPAQVKALLDEGANVQVIDVRPWTEYHAMNIPGSTNLPGCELVYRIDDVVKDPETMIVINCAGRTRSIVGTQTLVNAGISNRVAALKGGTMNWSLNGYDLEYGANRTSAPPSFSTLLSARERALAVAEKYGVPFIDTKTLEAWKDEQSARTLYIFDVRQPEEYAAGHLRGARNAPGGQLVQATDEYAAVRNARFVLVDDTDVRAVMTAHWLKQMGMENVFVLRGGIGQMELVRGSREKPFTGTFPEPSVNKISALVLQSLLGRKQPPLVLNVGASKRHKTAHIPGAVWVIRAYLEKVHGTFPDAKEVILTSDTGRLACFAAKDAEALWPNASIRVLRGGNDAWAAAGLPLEAGLKAEFCPVDDIWYKPYEDTNADRESMKEYFAWEAGLVESTKADGCVEFRLGPVKK